MINKINRFERKWIFNSRDYLTLVSSLMRSKFFFRTHYPTRRVNSIYFDTNDYSSIRQNLDGVSEKKKIRIRWYGNYNKLVEPILEIKSKKGAETRKENYKINDLEGLEFPNLKNLYLIKNFINKSNKSKKTVLPSLTTN